MKQENSDTYFLLPKLIYASVSALYYSFQSVSILYLSNRWNMKTVDFEKALILSLLCVLFVPLITKAVLRFKVCSYYCVFAANSMVALVGTIFYLEENHKKHVETHKNILFFILIGVECLFMPLMTIVEMQILEKIKKETPEHINFKSVYGRQRIFYILTRIILLLGLGYTITNSEPQNYKLGFYVMLAAGVLFSVLAAVFIKNETHTTAAEEEPENTNQKRASVFGEIARNPNIVECLLVILSYGVIMYILSTRLKSYMGDGLKKSVAEITMVESFGLSIELLFQFTVTKTLYKIHPFYLFLSILAIMSARCFLVYAAPVTDINRIHFFLGDFLRGVASAFYNTASVTFSRKYAPPGQETFVFSLVSTFHNYIPMPIAGFVGSLATEKIDKDKTPPPSYLLFAITGSALTAVFALTHLFIKYFKSRRFYRHRL
ncbi:MAG: uncharacterized protein A8A55_2439 [Amphiamblys sp. WSBS2006]|nr:MAG: uncharacterized protein A8A55_2439 [Amphiamblys sp. WSBS2006]